MTETQELLASFVQHGSEPAFRELVTRYIDLVYSTAVRQVDGDTHRAEDVAQIVFADLARMARKLSSDTMLGGWLHRHTCFVARTVMRGERRREARERQAVEMSVLSDQSGSLLERIAPMLDEAINELGADDREAILLRFFEGQKLHMVGETLGISENVAQKRVARALQELGVLLKRRGATLSVAGLASGLAAGAVTAAPAGLASTIAGTVLASGVAAGGISVAPAKVALATKAAIIGAMAIVGVATVVFLQTQPREKAGKQPGQVQAHKAPGPESFGDVGTSPIGAQLGDPKRGSPKTPVPGEVVATTGALPSASSIVAPERAVAGRAEAPTYFTGSPGSKLRIEGSSTAGDWQVECPFIVGFWEVGPDFALRMTQPIDPGPIQVHAEASVAVRSLRSIDKDGRPFSDRIDSIMYEMLGATRHPRMVYRLAEMSLKGATNYHDILQVEFESHGDLVVAGVTNKVSMPVFLVPLGADRLKILGSMVVKMTSFRIDPTSVSAVLPFEMGDEVKISFEWELRPRKDRSTAARK